MVKMYDVSLIWFSISGVVVALTAAAKLRARPKFGKGSGQIFIVTLVAVRLVVPRRPQPCQTKDKMHDLELWFGV